MDSRSQAKELYSLPQVERLLGIPSGRLRYWSRSGLIGPSGKRNGKKFYTFQDLVALRSVKKLTDEGLSASQIQRAIETLKSRQPQRSSLSELRLSAEGARVAVKEDDEKLDAESGQLFLSFDLERIHEQVVELVRPERPGSAQRQRAFEHYLEGCQLETHPMDMERAEQAYLRALDLDPTLACAYTNLGNLRYRSGAVEDAKALYEKALELEPSQPEAQYNVALLTYEEDDLEEAAERFRVALQLDPELSDAHFNLAVTLSELGHMEEALHHYTTYLELEPNGPWAALAREEIEHA